MLLFLSYTSPTANPAILAAKETVSIPEGGTVELEVYLSGYPVPTESNITWWYPNGSTILNTDFGVMFQGEGRKLILSNVESEQSGSYQCSVITSTSPYMGTTTSIQLDAYYGECVVEL